MKLKLLSQNFYLNSEVYIINLIAGANVIVALLSMLNEMQVAGM